MADRTIKPDSGNDLVLQNNGGGTKIEIPNSGDIAITGTIGSGTFNGTIGSSASGSANLPAVKTALNASGSAGIYACRAWVQFNANGTIAGSGNVSSVDDEGVGLYKVNFTTAMPDANYAVVTSGRNDANGAMYLTLRGGSGNGPATGSVQVTGVNGANTIVDLDTNCVSVFR